MLMKMKRCMKNGGKALRGEKGFTLIELLIVIAIIGILATMALPGLLDKRQDAQVAATQSDLRTAATVFASLAAEGDQANFNENTYGVTGSNSYNSTTGTFSLSKNGLSINQSGTISGTYSGS